MENHPAEDSSLIANLQAKIAVLEQRLEATNAALEAQVEDCREELGKARQALAIANLRLEALLESIPAAVWIADGEGRIVVKNRMVDEIWGQGAPLSQTVGGYREYKGWWAQTGEPLRAEDWGLARAVMKGEKSVGEEVDIQRFDSARATILNSAAPITDDSGRRIGAVVISQDITLSKRAERQLARTLEENQQQKAQLQHQKELLEATFSALTDAVIVFDNDDVIRHANQAAIQSYGYDPVGKPRDDAVPTLRLRYMDGTPVPPHELPSSRVRRGLQVQQEPFCYTDPSGQERIVLNTASPMLDSAGRLQGIVVVWQDITEREALLKENRRQRELLERLVQEAPAGIAFLEGPEHRYRLVNAAYQHIARGKGDLVGRTVKDAWPEIAAEIVPLLDLVYETGEPYSAVEQPLLIRREAGLETNYFTYTFTSIHTATGEVEGVMILAVETTEAALSRQQADAERALLEAILQQMPSGVIIVSPHGGKVLNANRKSREIFGESFALPPEPVRSTSHTNGRPYAAVEWPLARLISTGETIVDEEITYQIQDSGTRTLSLRSAPVFNAAKEIIAGVVVLDDITERKRTERELQESEERYRQLADSMPQLVWEALPDGTVDYYNRRYVEFDGIQTGPGAAWQWAPVLHPADQEPTIRLWEHSVRTGEMYQIEHRVRMAGGEYRWHLSRGVPAYSAEGRILRWYGTATDIHDQKQVEEALRRSESRLRRLVESNIIGVIFRDADGNVLEANDAFLEILGYSRQDLHAGKVHWRTITPTEYLPRDREAMAEAFKTGACTPYEKEYLRKDGTRVPILIGYARVDDPQQQYVGFILDLSAQENAQAALAEYAERLEHSNRELEQFAFVASHDLQEPLRKISLFGQRLQESLTGRLDEQEQDFLGRMISASSRMHNMIEGLLAFSRVTTQARPFAPVDLQHVVQEVLSDLEVRIQNTGALVEVADLPVIEADALQMHRLLQNLIGNALKFHRPEATPHVRVSARTLPGSSGSRTQAVAAPTTRPVPGSLVELVVEDDGIGFDPQYLDRIFRPFERLHLRSEYEGSGMGLAICHKIVARHHGTLTAESAPDEGARFIAWLPLRQNV